MVKAFYILIAANLSAAAVFFTTGIMAQNGLLMLSGWIFAGSSLLLFVFLTYLRRRLAKIQREAAGE